MVHLPSSVDHVLAEMFTSTNNKLKWIYYSPKFFCGVLLDCCCLAAKNVGQMVDPRKAALDMSGSGLYNLVSY